MATIHADDVAGASWACAEWMSGLGRKEANSLAGEEILSNDKSKVKDASDLPEADRKLVAPLFNLVSFMRSRDRLQAATNLMHSSLWVGG
jgi:hypothetical protein